MRRFGTAVATAVVALTAACTSSSTTPTTAPTTALTSTPTSSPPTTPGSVGTTTTAAPSSRTATSQTSSTSQAPTTAPPSCLADAGKPVSAIVDCIGAQLSAFWTKRLHKSVRLRVVFRPTLSDLPRDCRGGTLPKVAFECTVNKVVYYPASELQRTSRQFHGASLVYVYAYVLGHETGHVVQDTLGQPTRATIEKLSPEAGEHLVEQQADCLSGVWAHQVGWLAPATFARVARTEIASISDAGEISVHGTPAQRDASVARGLASGLPSRCGITGVR